MSQPHFHWECFAHQHISVMQIIPCKLVKVKVCITFTESTKWAVERELFSPPICSIRFCLKTFGFRASIACSKTGMSPSISLLLDLSFSSLQTKTSQKHYGDILFLQLLVPLLVDNFEKNTNLWWPYNHKNCLMPCSDWVPKSMLVIKGTNLSNYSKFPYLTHINKQITILIRKHIKNKIPNSLCQCHVYNHAWFSRGETKAICLHATWAQFHKACKHTNLLSMKFLPW